MTPDDVYVQAVVNRHRAAAPSVPARLLPLLRSWNRTHLESVTLAGSHPKGTALKDSDRDLFLSLSPDTPGPVSAIQMSLAAHFRYYFPEIRNVSVRIRFEGEAIDLVPGRRRPDSAIHTLWQSRRGAWLQTDIAAQIRYVASSRLINEILALKIWRRARDLRFPSFLLELAAIRALSPGRPLAESFLDLLRYLATDFPSARLLDPANSNNIVSAALTLDEKLRIARAAELSLRAPAWPDILD